MNADIPAHDGPTPLVPPDAGFQQRLGLFDAVMLVVGTMIGSGIFVTSADMARDLGSSGWLLAAWGLTAVMTIFGALCYAELAAMMPHAGGQYVFLREAYSPLWGFLYGWSVFLVIQTGSIAAVAVAFAKFLGVLIPAFSMSPEAGAVTLLQIKFAQPWQINMPLPWLDKPLTVFERKEFVVTLGHCVAVAMLAGLSLLNCLGVREGKWVQNLFTVAKTLALALLIVLGLTIAVNPAAVNANLENVWGGITSTPRFVETEALLPASAMTISLMVLGGAMVGSLFSADAWNNVTFTAAEVQNPRRNLPLCLILGTGLVMVLYMLANLAYLAVLPVMGNPDATTTFERGIAFAQDDRVGTAVLETASPGFGVPFMAIAIMISTFGCVNGMVLMGARLYYAMAQDGLFFQAVGKLNSRGVPAAGLILQGLWSILLVFSGTYSELLDFVIFAVLVFYVLTVVGLFILRRRLPDLPRPYRVFGYPFLPAIYVFLCAAIMIDLLIVRPVYTWPGLIIVLSGIPVYFLWRAFGTKPPVPHLAPMPPPE